MTQKPESQQLPFNSQVYLAEGCGNSFIILEKEDKIETVVSYLTNLKVDSALILKLVFINAVKAVYEMTVVEKDGSVSEFCGNGARAIAAYLLQNYGDKRSFFIRISKTDIPIGNCDLGYYADLPFPKVNTMNSKFSKIKDSPFHLFDYTVYTAQAIEPHLITLDIITEKQLTKVGEHINTHRNLFPFGMNINMVKVIDSHTLHNTTYERGVNGITKSCGSGSACAIAVGICHKLIKLPCIVTTLGGNLHFSNIKNGIRMAGKASCQPL